MDNIINHRDLPALNTFNSHLKYGTINPLTRKSYKQVVNINTRFRNNYSITSSTDFGFNLPTPIKKIVSMKLIDIEFPAVIYTVSPLLGSNTFKIGNGSGEETAINISKGSYSGTDMTISINKAILGSLNSDISATILSFEKITGKMMFSNPDISFSLNFDYIDPSNCPNIFIQTGSNIYKDQLTLGWLLGFRQNYKFGTQPNAHKSSNPNYKNKIRNAAPSLTELKNNGYRYLKNNYTCCEPYIEPSDICYNYTGSKSYTAEGLYDSHGSRYFLLSINDYQNNHTTAVVSPLQQETLGDGNILAKISSRCCGVKCFEYPERLYFGPTDVSKLHIILYDEFGRIVDMNNDDFSFTLELEILYDL